MKNATLEASYMRVTVAQYSADEVIQQFLALYNCMDFKLELEDIGISRFQFVRRKKVLRELRALSIALWGLALKKSFPKDAVHFFETFRASFPVLFPVAKEQAMMENRVNIYVDCLNAKKDMDFLPVAEYLAEVLALDADDTPRLRLRLSLITRNLYTMIFDRLV
ncbi:MAG: hypothetical protein LBC94_02220 [Desulfovibrio sp.]|jgi:hypothetical protein|nr:hypothetical protein [Desulfovibrio sp.]